MIATADKQDTPSTTTTVEGSRRQAIVEKIDRETNRLIVLDLEADARRPAPVESRSRG